MDAEPRSEFERAAAEAPQGVVREFWAFLRHNKKWWLVPLVVVLVLMGVLMFLGSSPVAPFIYSIF